VASELRGRLIHSIDMERTSTTNPDDGREARLERAREIIGQGTKALPSLPEAAWRAGRAAEDPDSTTDDLVDILTQDPALCGRLLKIANSPFYGARTEVANVKQAAVILGRTRLRNVALAASVQSVFGRRKVHESYSQRSLWTHSIRTAGAASFVASESGACDPDDAFVAGLLHDVGVCAEAALEPVALSNVIDRVERMPELARSRAMAQAERRIFDTDHLAIGAVLCESWGLPERLFEVLSLHHDPQAIVETGNALAGVVLVAEASGAGSEHGLADHPVTWSADPGVLRLLGLDAAWTEARHAALVEVADAAEAAFGAQAEAA